MQQKPYTARRAVALIDQAALAKNFTAISHALGGRTVAVVKADAYGHGLALSVPALSAAGCNFFAVATVEEGVRVRSLSPKAEILLLGYTPLQQAHLLLTHRLTQAVFSLPYGEALSRTLVRRGARARVHLKIDGGMCRLGLDMQDTNALRALLALPGLAVCGAFTHLPSPAEAPAQTGEALARFTALCRALPQPLFCHAAAGAALTHPDARLDGVRAGLSLYGYPTAPGLPPLSRVLSLHAPVVQIREVPRGTPIGYGGDFCTARPSRIGTLPIGYADGLSRTLTGMQVTLCHGGRRFPVPICGRICMDYCMVDLTDTPAAVGDGICIFEDAAAVAKRLGTIPYEVLTAIGTRVRRQQKGAGR